jgi:hypothetical protein
MAIRSKNDRMKLSDKIFWCFVGISGGIILFSFDYKHHYMIFDSFKYLVEIVNPNPDDVYLPNDQATTVIPLVHKARPIAASKGMSSLSIAIQHTNTVTTLRPTIAGYVVRYCMPLEFGGAKDLENSFYQAPVEASRRDAWIHRFDVGVHSGKIPLKMAQEVFAHRCDPGEW